MRAKIMFRNLVFTYLISISFASQAGCYSDFDKLMGVIASDDSVLRENTDGYFIEEVVMDENRKVLEKRRLTSIPEKYTYSGRLYPNEGHLRGSGLSLYVRRRVIVHIRVVTEKASDGTEPSSYWFWKVDGCWKLRSRAVYLSR